ncbi:hypothetical protein [Enterococcus hirae]|uniref:hypothetical protein n=1 Tax=Enterococcus hirae TaxID=1354 RepID=UPI00136B8DE7|nr:hypothetical protein [Enterococcus hirae]NAE18055.1 hypothetical protein [Enterococcus hirae]
MPRNSHYIQAIADDRDAAQAYLDSNPPEAAEHRERWVDWSPEREALQQVIDRLGAVVTTLISVNGHSAPHIEPGARPQSQVELMRAERDLEVARSWMNRFAPPDRRLRAAEN